MDFSRVEAEFHRFKGQFETGALSEAEFKAQLENLMLQDERGRWWMIGYETGQWYYHDGAKWVRSDPPRVEPPARPVEPQVGAEAAIGEEWREVPPPIVEPRPVEATGRPAEAKARIEETPRQRARREPAARPAVPANRLWVWVAAGVIALILLYLILQGTIFPPPGQVARADFWAEPDVIQPGSCALLRWNAPTLEAVRLHGGGLDTDVLRPPSGRVEVCPGETTQFELKNPDFQVLETVTVKVGR